MSSEEKSKILCVRVTEATLKEARKILYSAQKKDLKYPGRKHPVSVKQSHVLRLAIEEGLSLVLDRLKDIDMEVSHAEP